MEEQKGTEERKGAEPGMMAVAAGAAAASQLAGERDALAALLALRLRLLRRICAAMLASVALLAAASLAVVRVLPPAAPAAASTDLSLILTACAAALILLASRFQSTILRSSARGVLAAPPRPAAVRLDTVAEGASGAAAPAAVAAAVVAAGPSAAAAPQAAVVARAYARSTIVGFALLDGAAALGLAVAAVTGTARYALVICAAAALGMLARWPRRAAVLALVRRTASIGASA